MDLLREWDNLQLNEAVVYRVKRIIAGCAARLGQLYRNDREIWSERDTDTDTTHGLELCVMCMRPVDGDKIWIVTHDPLPGDLPHQCCSECWADLFRHVTDDGPLPVCPWPDCEVELHRPAEPDADADVSKTSRAKHLLSTFADRYRIVKLKVSDKVSIFKQRRADQPQALQNFKELSEASAEHILVAATQEGGDIGEYLSTIVEFDSMKKHLCKYLSYVPC